MSALTITFAFVHFWLLFCWGRVVFRLAAGQCKTPLQLVITIVDSTMFIAVASAVEAIREILVAAGSPS